MKTELFPYQKKVASDISKMGKDGKRRVIVALPTGAGKTETALSIISDEVKSGGRCLVITERKVLCNQWVDRAIRHGMPAPGILQGSNTGNLDSQVIVSTAQTIARRGIAQDEFSLIVIDECHYWHQSHQKIVDNLHDNATLIGLSATPLNRNMVTNFEAVTAPISVKDLVEQGFLVKPRYFVASSAQELRKRLNQIEIVNGDYRQSDLTELMTQKGIVGDVIETWKAKGEDRQTIAFCVGKHHAKSLADDFVAAGISAAAITEETTDEERRNLFKAFDACAIRILCSINVLAVGFDSPVASCAIMARPTMSKSLKIQMEGRVIRRYPGKVDAIILDHAGNATRMGMIQQFAVPNCIERLIGVSDRVKKSDPMKCSDVRECKSCYSVYERELSECPECGTPPPSQVVRIVEGTLSEVGVDSGQSAPGHDMASVQKEYYKALRFARWAAFKNGWAYHYINSKYGFAPPQTIFLWLEPLDQNDLFNMMSAAKLTGKIGMPSLGSVNGELDTFTINCKRIGNQMISIPRMRYDPKHIAKCLIALSDHDAVADAFEPNTRFYNTGLIRSGANFTDAGYMAKRLIEHGMAEELPDGLLITSIPFDVATQRTLGIDPLTGIELYGLMPSELAAAA